MSSTHAPSPSEAYFTSPTLIITILLVVFFFIAFFSVFFCRYFIQTTSFQDTLHEPTLDKSPSQGLDPEKIKSFPCFVYSSVKNSQKYGLECAICICEFLDDDNIRMLPSCRHVFHQECIDLWLEKNKTCPVCRGNLEIPCSMCGINEDEPLADSVSINIPNIEEEMRRRVDGARVEITEITEKFPRSYSTGHSIKKRDDLAIDRFTLRLPDHEHARLVRGHKISLTFFEGSTSMTETTRGGFGEISDVANDNISTI